MIENNKNDSSESSEKIKTDDGTKTFRAWALAGELGYLIAIPIVVFALLGRFADKFFGTAPWLLLAGILISIFSSTWLIYRKVREII